MGAAQIIVNRVHILQESPAHLVRETGLLSQRNWMNKQVDARKVIDCAMDIIVVMKQHTELWQNILFHASDFEVANEVRTMELAAFRALNNDDEIEVSSADPIHAPTHNRNKSGDEFAREEESEVKSADSTHVSSPTTIESFHDTKRGSDVESETEKNSNSSLTHSEDDTDSRIGRDKFDDEDGDKDEEVDEEDEESLSSRSSSSWSLGSCAEEVKEFEQKRKVTESEWYRKYGKLDKLDEFALRSEEEEEFDRSQRAHNELFGANGNGFREALTNEAADRIGHDFVTDRAIAKWRRSRSGAQ